VFFDIIYPFILSSEVLYQDGFSFFFLLLENSGRRSKRWRGILMEDLGVAFGVQEPQGALFWDTLRGFISLAANYNLTPKSMYSSFYYL